MNQMKKAFKVCWRHCRFDFRNHPFIMFLMLHSVQLRACICAFVSVTHRRAGWWEVLQHVGDDDLQQSLPEELLANCAAVVVVFLTGKTRITNTARGHQWLLVRHTFQHLTMFCCHFSCSLDIHQINLFWVYLTYNNRLILENLYWAKYE